VVALLEVPLIQEVLVVVAVLAQLEPLQMV
jgi:hypothetical protein